MRTPRSAPNLAISLATQATTPIAPAAAAGAEIARLCFAGLHFEFEGAPALLEQLKRVPCVRPWDAGAVSEVRGARVTRCRVAAFDAAEALAQAAARSVRSIEWSWRGERATLLGRFVSAELQYSAAESRANARLTANRRGAESLLTALAASLLHRLGGAILHAASLELEGVALALIGPSGAGKSTASRQLSGARAFSVDRLVVAPAEQGGWLAFPLPGGTRSALDLPPTSCTRAPLRAILRVRKSTQGTRLEACSLPMAVALLRESAFHPGVDPDAEQELLAHLQGLAREVPVANLHSSLGTMLGPPLGRWLAQRQTKTADQGQALP
jgi:hypothetical protein